MKKLFFLLLITITGTSFAQVTEINYQLSSYLDFFRGYKMATGDVRSTLSEKEIKGSPYLNDDFINGSLFTTSQVEYADIPLRYNIYNDELEFKNPDNQVLALATPEILVKAIFGNYVVEYLPYEVANKVRQGYFLTLVKGKASLYVRNEVDYQPPVAPGPYKEPEPARFIRKNDSYFIRIGELNAKRVDNKKELIAAFPDKQEKIESFIKKNKIGTKDAEDLIKVAEYYNSL